MSTEGSGGKKSIFGGANVNFGVLEVVILLLKIGALLEGFFDGIGEDLRFQSVLGDSGLSVGMISTLMRLEARGSLEM